MALDENFVNKIKKHLNWVAENATNLDINTEIPQRKIAMSSFLLAIEHSDAIGALQNQQLFRSMLALCRPSVEALLNGIFALYAATDEEAQQFLKEGKWLKIKDGQPKINEQGHFKELSLKERRNRCLTKNKNTKSATLAYLNKNFKKNEAGDHMLHFFHDFVHGGNTILKIAFRDGLICSSNVPENIQRHFLKDATQIALCAASELIGMTGDEALAQEAIDYMFIAFNEGNGIG
jgi:hypothetical protein